MFCTNCGSKLNGKKCPICDGKKIPLTVTRPKSMVGMAISFTVYVDGKDIGKLKNNTSLSCDVTVGAHTVIIKSLEKDLVQNILVKEDTNSVEMIAGVKMGFLAGRANLKDVIYK